MVSILWFWVAGRALHFFCAKILAVAHRSCTLAKSNHMGTHGDEEGWTKGWDCSFLYWRIDRAIEDKSLLSWRALRANSRGMCEF